MKMRVTRVQIADIRVRRTGGTTGLEHGFHDAWWNDSDAAR